MLQSLDVISVNLWLTLISLANLVILFLLIKRFLFKPVKKIMDIRHKEIGEEYEKAKKAEKEARKSREEWQKKINIATDEAELIVSEASENANKQREKIVNEAKEAARQIINRAEADAALEYEKATDNMKKQIVELSGVLTEKILEREINKKDHRNLIDYFIHNIGDDSD